MWLKNDWVVWKIDQEIQPLQKINFLNPTKNSALQYITYFKPLRGLGSHFHLSYIRGG